MKKFLYLILLSFAFNNQTYSQREILIKYSLNDCILCNTNLYNLIRMEDKIPITVCFKKTEYHNSNYLDVIDFLNKNNIKIVTSDSLYYAVDSNERSMIYALENKKIVKKEYLKSVHLNEFVGSMPNSKKDEPNIETPGLTKVVVDNNYIYMGQRDEPYIIRVSKNNLNVAYDTIPVFNENIKHKIFELLYGANADAKLSEIGLMRQHMFIPKGSSLSDMAIQKNGNLIALITIYTISLTPKTGSTDTLVSIKPVPIILSFSKGSLKDIHIMDNQHIATFQHNGYTDTYQTYPMRVFPYQNTLFAIVNPDTAHYLSPILAKMTLENGKYAINSFTPYAIDSSFIDNGIGTHMISSAYCEPYFIEAYSKKIIDLNDNTFYVVPVDAENNFIKKQFSNLTLNPNYWVMSMSRNEDKLRLIIKVDSTLAQVTYFIDKNAHLQFADKKILTYNFPDNEYNRSLTCDSECMYEYDLDTKKIIMLPYK